MNESAPNPEIDVRRLQKAVVHTLVHTQRPNLSFMQRCLKSGTNANAQPKPPRHKPL